jgi:glutamate/tyrosine decarboxylase-like PLP-dependent enzyme
MDPQALEVEIKKQINKGVYGFIISLTLGYTETGTSDNLQKINNVIKKLKKQYKKISISIIIDAAFNGLIEPFLTNDFRPFISKNIHIFSVDFSKFTAIPFPAGVVLYRKQLRKMIERDVQFFPVPDNTLLGSRPGASAAAIWGTIHHLGISGYRKIIERQIKVKNHFIKNILSIFPDVEIISDPHSLTCGVIFTKKQFKMLPKQIEYQYRVYAKEESILFSGGLTRRIIICKFFFLAHMTKKSVDDIILSIRNSINEK